MTALFRFDVCVFCTFQHDLLISVPIEQQYFRSLSVEQTLKLGKNSLACDSKRTIIKQCLNHVLLRSVVAHRVVYVIVVSNSSVYNI